MKLIFNFNVDPSGFFFSGKRKKVRFMKPYKRHKLIIRNLC